ncbi:hypothetical protein B0H13DRAFT_2365286 [Mycena leptocephala]|nr:hypothetical protein B0H13DRAFT_2365286 [Mycena leptocephala]
MTALVLPRLRLEPDVVSLQGIDPALLSGRLPYLVRRKEPLQSATRATRPIILEIPLVQVFLPSALCLVLHTTYPTLQRTFVVTYVILILRAFVHRLAPIRPIPLSSTHPRAHLIAPPRGAHICPRIRWPLPPASHTPIAPRDSSRVRPTKAQITKRPLSVLVASLAWPQRCGERAAAALSPSLLLFVSPSHALSETRARIHFPALFVA